MESSRGCGASGRTQQRSCVRRQQTWRMCCQGQVNEKEAKTKERYTYVMCNASLFEYWMALRLVSWVLVPCHSNANTVKRQKLTYNAFHRVSPQSHVLHCRVPSTLANILPPCFIYASRRASCICSMRKPLSPKPCTSQRLRQTSELSRQCPFSTSLRSRVQHSALHIHAFAGRYRDSSHTQFPTPARCHHSSIVLPACG